MKTIHTATIVLLIGCVMASGPVSAQAQTQPQAQQPAPATTNIDPKNLAVAKDIVRSMDYANTVQNIMTVVTKSILPLVLRDNPQHTQEVQTLALDSVQKAFATHMEELANNKAVVYAQIYSYDELVQLKAFYQSPVGQKSIKTLPEMMQKSIAMDSSIIKKAMEDSKQILMEELKKSGMKVPKEIGT